MEKLKALMDFSLVKEQRQVIKDEEILVCGDEEKIPAPTGEIIVDEKRAKEIESFRHEGKALVERIKVEDKEDDNDDDTNEDDSNDDDTNEDDSKDDDTNEDDSKDDDTNEDDSKDDDKEDLKGKEGIETADLKKGKVETATVKAAKKSTKK